MSNQVVIIIGAIITALLCAVAWWQNRKGNIILSSFFLLMMSFGSMGIAAFYLTVVIHGVDDEVVTFSRILWAFILFSTTLIALSVITRGKDGRTDGK